LGLVTIFYFLRFETSHFVASYDSQGHGVFSSYGSQGNGVFSSYDSQGNGVFSSYDSQGHGVFSSYDSQGNGAGIQSRLELLVLVIEPRHGPHRKLLFH
jgi:hypothetical protein